MVMTDGMQVVLMLGVGAVIVTIVCLIFWPRKKSNDKNDDSNKLTINPGGLTVLPLIDTDTHTKFSSDELEFCMDAFSQANQAGVDIDQRATVWKGPNGNMHKQYGEFVGSIPVGSIVATQVINPNKAWNLQGNTKYPSRNFTCQNPGKTVAVNY